VQTPGICHACGAVEISKQTFESVALTGPRLAEATGVSALSWIPLGIFGAVMQERLLGFETGLTHCPRIGAGLLLWSKNYIQCGMKGSVSICSIRTDYTVTTCAWVCSHVQGLIGRSTVCFRHGSRKLGYTMVCCTWHSAHWISRSQLYKSTTFHWWRMTITWTNFCSNISSQHAYIAHIHDRGIKLLSSFQICIYILEQTVHFTKLSN
jgi:hypothetical protein